MALDAVRQLAGRGEGARAISAQAVARADQTEFHRVPIETGQIIKRVETLGFHATLAVGLEIIGENLVEQHRHMAEEIVKNIRLDDVLKLLGLSQPHRNRETAVGKVGEEDVVWYQSRHRYQRPAGGWLEPGIDFVKVRNASAEIERVQAVDEFVARILRHQRRLARIQALP